MNIDKDGYLNVSIEQKADKKDEKKETVIKAGRVSPHRGSLPFLCYIHKVLFLKFTKKRRKILLS